MSWGEPCSCAPSSRLGFKGSVPAYLSNGSRAFSGAENWIRARARIRSSTAPGLTDFRPGRTSSERPQPLDLKDVCPYSLGSGHRLGSEKSRSQSTGARRYVFGSRNGTHRRLRAHAGRPGLLWRTALRLARYECYRRVARGRVHASRTRYLQAYLVMEGQQAAKETV